MSRPSVRRIGMVLFASSLLAPATDAASMLAAQDWFAWNAYWENDSFLKRDSSATTGDDAYTNGIRFVASRNPARNTGRWSWVDRFGDWWAGSFLTRNGREHDEPAASLVFGQNFFTPNVITDFEVDSTDRPFAGILYAGLRIDLTEVGGTGARSRMAHAIEVDLGILGSPAQSGPIQSGVHVLRSSRIPKGWHHEIGPQPLVQLNYLWRARVGWSRFDVVPHLGLLAGNPQTGGYGGMTARLALFGRLSDFPALAIPMTAVGEPGRSTVEFSLLAGVEGRGFLRQAFIPKHMVGDSILIEMEPWVYDYRLGFSLRADSWRVSGTYIKRSDEITGPHAGEHDFLSVGIGYEPDSQARPDVEGSWFFPRLHFEAGLGNGWSDIPAAGSQKGIGLHWSAGIGLPAVPAIRLPDNRVILGIEGNGIAREGPRPPTGEPHTDEFVSSLLGTIRWRPLGHTRFAIFDVRAGLGMGKHKTQIVPPLAGTPGVCPPGTSLDDPDRPRFCEATDQGLGVLIGAALTVPMGNQVSAGVDVSWSSIDADGETRSFWVPAFTLRYHPSG